MGASTSTARQNLARESPFRGLSDRIVAMTDEATPEELQQLNRLFREAITSSTKDHQHPPYDLVFMHLQACEAGGTLPQSARQFRREIPHLCHAVQLPGGGGAT